MSEPLHDAHVYCRGAYVYRLEFNRREHMLKKFNQWLDEPGDANTPEFDVAWEKHEQLDQCKAEIQRWESLKQNAPTPSEAIAAEGKLAGLRAELAGLLSQLSGSGQEQAKATASHARATTEQRRARRYQMCIDDGLKMPDNDYAPLPRGIAEIAKREGITRQSLAEDLKAHIRRLHGR